MFAVPFKLHSYRYANKLQAVSFLFKPILLEYALEDIK